MAQKRRDPRLEEFKKLPKDTPWPERAKLIRERFPHLDKLNWNNVFEEREDIFAAIVRDILREDFVVPGKSGPRPSLEWDDGYESLKYLSAQDFCHMPFPQAFKVLLKGRSLRQAAKLTGLSLTTVHRLINGEVEPDLYTMQQVAKAFKKHPNWFAEYRAAYVLSHLENRLMQASESTLGFYNRLREQLGDG